MIELEINIKFPTCWDGVNTESVDGNHVAYSVECDGDEHNECFDFDCPASHPVKMPEIHLYVRVLGYEGGAHMFADGGDVSTILHFIATCRRQPRRNAAPNVQSVGWSGPTTVQTARDVRPHNLTNGADSRPLKEMLHARPQNLLQPRKWSSPLNLLKFQHLR